MRSNPIQAVLRLIVPLSVHALLAAPGGFGAESPSERSAASETDATFLRIVEEAARLTTPEGAGPVLSLQEALWLTLALQPGVRLSDEAVRSAEAFFRQAQGVFDWNLLARVSKDRPVVPLSQRDVNAQIFERERLRALSTSMNRVARAIETGQREVDILVPGGDGDMVRRTVDPRTLFINNGGALELREEPNAVSGVGLADSLGVINQGVGSADIESLRQRLLAQQEAVFLQGAEAAWLNAQEPVRTVSRTEILEYQAGLQKLFRNGVVLSPNLFFVQEDDDNIGQAVLDLFIPLLRDRGARIERANEASARIDFEASGQQLVHTYSEALLQTATAFWNVLARQQELQLLRLSEDIYQTFVDLTRLRLIAGEAGGSELAIASSSLMAVRAARLGVEFTLLEARRNLALAVGFAGDELLAAPSASGALPFSMLRPMAATDLVLVAHRNRRDLLAAQSLQQSGRILAEATYDNIRPRLDLQMRLAMTGRNQGSGFGDYFTTFGEDTAGLGVLGSLNFQWPVQNRLAKGVYLESEAEYRRRQLGVYDLERTIANNAVLAYEEARIAAQQVEANEEAARYAKDALVAERALYEQGQTSLLDAVQLQDQYVFILRSVIFSRLSYSVALSQLRFETGVLIEGGSGNLGDYASVTGIEVAAVPDFEDYLAAPAPIPLPRPKHWRERLDEIRGSSALPIAVENEAAVILESPPASGARVNPVPDAKERAPADSKPVRMRDWVPRGKR